MDAGVDDYLGDSISYAVDGVNYATITGFLIDPHDKYALDGVQPTRSRWQMKVHRTKLPDGPKKAHRIMHPRLGVLPFRPAADTISDTGDYFLFDIIKAN